MSVLLLEPLSIAFATIAWFEKWDFPELNCFDSPLCEKDNKCDVLLHVPIANALKTFFQSHRDVDVIFQGDESDVFIMLAAYYTGAYVNVSESSAER